MKYIQNRIGHTISTVFESKSLEEITYKLEELIATQEGDFYLSNKPTKDWKVKLDYKQPKRGLTRLYNLNKSS